MSDFQITSTVLHYIVKKIKDELCLGYINNVQTIDKNIWKIKIHKKRTKELIVTPQVCFLSKNSFPVIDALGFEKYLKKKLYNQRIQEIYQHKNNKVICFCLDKYNLIFEFFSKSNIILTDKDFKIITSKQKEEWKDRTIKKFENYVFPAGEDIKEKKIEDVKKDILGKDKKEIIKYFSKSYNVAPIEVDKIIEEEKEVVDQILKMYNLEKPKINKIEKNEKETYFIDSVGKEDLFEVFEEIYKDKYQKKEVIVESLKKEKSNTVLKAQEEKKQEVLEKIKILEKEGEFIYENFSLIEEINKQIKIATDKKIDNKDIIKKINDYFKLKNINFKINKIDQKNRTYNIEKLEK